jgi:hypothetical protein
VILHQGRGDSMIKRRGFRIELGEIEAVLSKLTSVSKCLVLEKANESKSPEMAAYVCVEDNRVLTEVRRELRERVPEYMVPDQFICIKDFPRLPNGKIDIQALLKMKEETIVHQEETNELEQKVIAIWSDLLQLSSLSKKSAFFDVGGAKFIETLINKPNQPEMTSLELLQKLEAGSIDLEIVKKQFQQK